MAKIRTAILGYGRSGSTLHANPIEANEDMEVVAVCDVDPDRRKQATERFGCPSYDDYHLMLKREELDFVVIVTRSDQHCQMTCDCLSGGAHVLVTKPWATSAHEGEKMIAAETKSGRMLFPWLPARWGVDLVRLKELITDGAIGKPFIIRRAVCSFATRKDWQTERRYGGGYLLNWGAHIIDPPVLLMNGKVESVYGRLKQTINPGDGEDLFMALMNLEDGTVVQAEYSVAIESLPNWFIQGDGGTIVVRGQDIVIYKATLPEPGDPTQVTTMKATDQTKIEEKVEGAVYGDEHQIYREVVQALRGEREFPVKPADALQLSRVFDAVRLSQDENRVVHLQ